MTHDVLRVIYGKPSKEVMAVMDTWVYGVLRTEDRTTEQGLVIGRWWSKFTSMIGKSEREEMEMRSRETMERLADVVMGMLLIVDARRDGDEIAAETAKMWIAERDGGDANATGSGHWQDRAAYDRGIVFGVEYPGEAKAKP
jgi:hypothetical protein